MHPRDFLIISIRLCATLALVGSGPGRLRAADDEKPIPAQRLRQIRVVQGGFGNLGLFTNINDDEAENIAAGPPKPDPAGPHLLEFADGSRLHGTLSTLDTAAGQLQWQRADASNQFVFPIADIGRLALHPDAKSETNAHATVKLTGGDWLAADVTGITDKKILLKLGEGPVTTIDREKVEWIYFSKHAAPECYVGPTSYTGWISGGGWTFRDGALRAAMPAVIGRSFEALPDQTEYFLEVDQGEAGHAFMLMVHNDNIINRVRNSGTIQFMFRAGDLRMWMQGENQMKSEQIDLSKKLPSLSGNGGVVEKKPVRFRVLEDYTGGRLLVFINGKKVADWTIDKGKAGENHGGVSFQPQGWNPDSEQVISQFRVIPWDGRVPQDDAPEDSASSTDLVSFGGGESKAGMIESLNGEHVKLRADGGTVEVPRAKIAMLRFHRAEHPSEEDPPVARVRLAQRGEFDVARLAFQQGKFTMRTNFGGELTLPPAALRGIDFARAPWSPPKPADELIFANGDRLRGTLASAATNQKLRWYTTRGETPIELDTSGLAGIALATPANPPAAKTDIVARLRNGDLLGGTLVKCDTDNLVVDSVPAGQFAVARDQVQSLYFAADGQPPVSDGGARRDIWTGVENDRNNPYLRTTAKKRETVETAKPRQPSTWHSFDGAFTYDPTTGENKNDTGMGSLRLAADFDSMPQLVELAFDVVFPRPWVAFTAQLFADDNDPGFMIQVYPQGVYLHDMGSAQQMRAGAQQQIQFGDKVQQKARERHIRVLANRRTGKLIVMVDGVLAGQLGTKPGAAPRKLGRNILLTGAASGPCSFANLWLGPWNGQPPDLASAPDAPPHTILLANGDETHGTVGTVTTEAVKIDSEAGEIDIPTERLTSIDFGGTPTARSTGTRLRLTEWCNLTVQSFRVEKDEIIAQGDLVGDFKVPRSAVREIVFARTEQEKSGAEKKREP